MRIERFLGGRDAPRIRAILGHVKDLRARSDSAFAAGDKVTALALNLRGMQILHRLVELFPTKIRYTSMSLPYHIGNGWFGGMLPLLATAMVAATGNIYFGLWYPIGIALLTFVVGMLFLNDNKDRPLDAD